MEITVKAPDFQQAKAVSTDVWTAVEAGPWRLRAISSETVDDGRVISLRFVPIPQPAKG